MIGRKKPTAPAVSRSYQPDPDDCVRAVELLLEKPLVSSEGGCGTAPNNAKGPVHGRAAEKKYT